MNVLRFLTPKSNVAYIYDDFTLRQTLEKMEYLPEKKKRKYIRQVRWNYQKTNLKLGWQKHALWTWMKFLLHKIYARIKG